MNVRFRRLLPLLLLTMAVIGGAGVVRARRAGISRPDPAAARSGSGPASRVSPAGRQPAPVSTPGDSGLAAVVEATLERNPFRAERASSGRRYEITVPGSAGTAAAATAAPAHPPIPSLKLAGLVAMSGGKGMAALEVAGSPSRLLTVGDTVAGFRLTSVSSTHARLERRDTSIVLLLEGPRP